MEENGVKEEESKEIGQKEKADQQEKPLDKMTVKDLREIALNIPNVAGVTAMKKDQLLALIKEHRGIEDKKPIKKKGTSKDKVSVKELKQKIVMLRIDKEDSYKKKDRKKTNILRRRINRLKKRTRTVGQA